MAIIMTLWIGNGAVLKSTSNILRWYEWDLLVFCKQTSLQLAAIGTLINEKI